MENQYYYPINMVRPEPVNNGPVVGGIERGFVHDVNDLKPCWFGRVLRKLSYILGILGIVVLITWVAPNVYYLVSGNSKAIEVFKRPLVGFGGLGRDKPVVSTEAERIFQPAVDPSLPNEDRLRIPYIGLDTQIHEASLDNYEDALKAGVWRVTDFGTPWSRNKPTILVAHRYGYLAWSNFFRKKSSFYNLPKKLDQARYPYL